ncbi:MAG: hypothetical protein J3Q66DRAFT_23549 [Benniella sp.]|nr:MAG: hypothetical protein J3Q66DRAFT_23549 [Benniella sp.]
MASPHSSTIPDTYPSPPSYEEAIGQSLLASPDTTSSDATSPHAQPEPSGLTPGDFVDAVAALRDFDERDIEDERDYEESRPLKMGRIPDARAQYTFIQPSDTIDVGNGSAYTCLCNQNHGPYPQQQQRLCPVHPGYSSSAPIASCPSPVLHAPSAPIAPASFEASSSAQESVLHQRRQNSTSKIMQANDMDSEYSTAGFPGSAGASGSTSHAVPSQPPPSSLYRSTQPSATPMAGVPSVPGDLMNAQDVSIADYKRTKRGAESYDQILEDPYQLYRFFVAHNDRPTMHLLIRGYHTEKRESTETDSDGNTKWVSKDIKVEDFKIDFDLTPYISPRGTLYTTPDPKTGNILTLREVMEQFVEEENTFKEMHLHKTVQWDYDELSRAITHAIRSTHYRYTIDISFPCTNNVVIVKSSSPLASFMRSGLTKALCFISLVGVVMYPAVSDPFSCSFLPPFSFCLYEFEMAELIMSPSSSIVRIG